MKFKDRYNIAPEFESLFAFKNENEEIEHEAKMIMTRFLSEIEKLHDAPIVKKDLAKKLGTSASFITQLFNGDKLISLTMLAKLQKAYDITFDIGATPNNFDYSESIDDFDFDFEDFGFLDDIPFAGRQMDLIPDYTIPPKMEIVKKQEKALEPAMAS